MRHVTGQLYGTSATGLSPMSDPIRNINTWNAATLDNWLEY